MPAKRPDDHSSARCFTPPKESVAHLPEPYRRWQCTCGAVWSLRDDEWEPLFMAPKSLRRQRVTLFSDSAVVGALIKEKERSEERQERLERAIGALIAAEGAMRSWSTKSPGDWWHIANSVHHAIHAARGECCHGLPEADCDAPAHPND